MTVLFFAAGAIFAVAAILALVRVVRGPSLLDRMIASDVLVTILLLVIGAEMVINEHTRNLVVMLVIAATASLATVAVSRYISQQGSQRKESDS